MKIDKSTQIMLLWLAIPIGLLVSQHFLAQLGLLKSSKTRVAADADMIEVAGGNFVMGLTVEEAWELNQAWRNPPDVVIWQPFTREIPQLEMYLNTFFIDKYEVTNAQYRRCIEADICQPISSVWLTLPEGYALDPTYDHYPVRGVTWGQADNYCRWIDKRLPTEAEWEKAARGPEGQRYAWGDEWDYQTTQPSQAKPAPVGSHPLDISPYGVMDLGGNAPEWTADRFSLYPGNPARDLHQALVAAGPMVVRGVAHDELLAVAAVRTPMFPNAQVYPIGFRCAQGPPPLALMISTPESIEPVPAGPIDLKRMVYIEAGEFTMGRNDIPAGAGRSEEKPTHQVYLDGFYIDRYETTVAEYVEFLNALGGHLWRCQGFHCAWQNSNGVFAQVGLRLADGQYEAQPDSEQTAIAYVPWHAAVTYCTWAGKRLPTEAEWEKAARGVDGRIYPWGNSWEPAYAANMVTPPGTPFPLPIGSYAEDVSPYGVYDMLGNVDEWVNDWYSPNYYAQSPYENPTGPSERQFHVNRGANNQTAERGITVRRGGRGPWVGFRCAYTPPS